MSKCYGLIFISLMLFFGCSKDNIRVTGSGSIITKDIILDDFQEIQLLGYCNVEVFTDTMYWAEVSDYENLVDYLQLKVVGNTLVISTDPENINVSNTKALAKVYLPGSLDALSLAGSGSMMLKSEFNHISELEISGSGNISGQIASVTNSLTADISGSGNIDVLNIQCQDADCNISGSGNIRVAVVNTLDATILGSGNVYYQGSPRIFQNISGSGSVIKL